MKSKRPRGQKRWSAKKPPVHAAFFFGFILGHFDISCPNLGSLFESGEYFIDACQMALKDFSVFCRQGLVFKKAYEIQSNLL